MYKKLLMIPAIILFVSCSSNNQDVFELNKATQGPAIVTINGQTIHEGFLDLLIEMNPRLKSQLDNPLSRKKILDSLIDQQLLYQEALKRDLDTKEDVIVKSLLNQHVIISNALIESELDNSMKKEYESRKDDQFTKIQVSLLASLFDANGKSAKNQTITKEQKAEALNKINVMSSRLKKGDDFSTVAKEDSDDKMSKKRGGDAGEISKDDRRFARLGLNKVVDIAFKMKKDEVSEPIETPNGYYIVKVTSDPIVVPFDEAQRILRFELQNKIKKQLVDNLRKSAKIDFAKADTPKSSMPNVQEKQSTKTETESKVEQK